MLCLGLSDHTPGHATVLGAVALGARVIEKHFTDDTTREGPDHKFAMDPHTWAEMVENTRRLEQALGSADKVIAENEMDTVIIQRRCVRAARDILAGEVLTREMIDVLRPATPGAILPDQTCANHRNESFGRYSCGQRTTLGDADKLIKEEKLRVLYCSENYSPHDHRFLTALADSGHEIYWLRLEDGGRIQESRSIT